MDVIRGPVEVKGFVGVHSGETIVVLVLQEGKHQGQFATSFVPFDQQLQNWGLK